MNQTEVDKVIAETKNEPLRGVLSHFNETIKSLGSSPALAAMRQELDALKATPSHTAGLCGKQECQPCQDAKIAVGHQVEEGIIRQFEGAAERYGLQDELSLLAEAVKHHRSKDAQWSPRQAAPGHLIQVG